MHPPRGGGAATEGSETAFGVEPFLLPDTWELRGLGGWPRAQHLEIRKCSHVARRCVSVRWERVDQQPQGFGFNPF